MLKNLRRYVIECTTKSVSSFLRNCSPSKVTNFACTLSLLNSLRKSVRCFQASDRDEKFGYPINARSLKLSKIHIS